MQADDVRYTRLIRVCVLCVCAISTKRNRVRRNSIFLVLYIYFFTLTIARTCVLKKKTVFPSKTRDYVRLAVQTALTPRLQQIIMRTNRTFMTILCRDYIYINGIVYTCKGGQVNEKNQLKLS